METLLFNNDSKQDLDLLLDIARKIGFDLKVAPKSSSKTEVKELSLKEKKYLNNLKKAATEMKEISSGKREAQTLQSFLDEL
ncbi:MAG TPA: hypothetical protein DCM02_13205 [Flavobacterium sp.]|nr:hypothetical protein [Flavobacterium sp.]HAT77121.1 hypothetical protein [Flavobacterium sp.]HAT81411.1 hypothetical protein [Flavobacterium sp.]